MALQAGTSLGPYQIESPLGAGALTQLFAWEFIGGGPRRMAVSRDGQQVLLLKDIGQSGNEDAPPPQINVVLNWFQEPALSRCHLLHLVDSLECIPSMSYSSVAVSPF